MRWPASFFGVRRIKTVSGRMRRPGFPRADPVVGGRSSLFCIMLAFHQEGYKYKRVGLKLKAPHGNDCEIKRKNIL